MYKVERDRWIKHIDFLLSDILCVEIAFVLAYMMKNGWSNLMDVEEYRHIAVILLFLPVCISFFTEPYSGVLRRGWVKEFVQTVKDVCMLMALCIYVCVENYGSVFKVGYIYLCNYGNFNSLYW